MIKPMQATSDGDAYESNDVEGIWTAGISLPFGPESIFSRSKDPIWYSRIECHGESKEDAEELRDAVLTAVSNPERLQNVTLAERLLPCPFCGSDAVMGEGQSDEWPWQVSCNGCGASSDHYVEEEHALAAWNRREAAAALSVRGDEFPLYEFTTLLMFSYPWPVTDNGHGKGEDAIEALADAEARKAGFDGWIDAYHQLKAPRTKP